ncbi:hypothetical protein BJI67_15785 (plasmid) [Acidihalobacter aeolianus]|uniref:PRTRC system protein C n=1 Tax=Acidihalobacter aeolianus TaxID=2792603 RepID=A0A1D8KCN4_9GAMM|nr:PRTRC system protein C [Acidihalobacter aeolianus]AOV18705.1 hypothetical protein BJI67_15785 [Acidihalobacter aeolianus]
MSEVIEIEARREFRMGAVKFPDPGSDYNPEQVLEFYRPNFPYLQGAVVEGPVVEGDVLVFTFVVRAKSKG